MTDYTIIVDDSNDQIIYGRDEDSWGFLDGGDHAYQGTLHNAMSQDATLTFAFVGDREVTLRGNFLGNDNASDSTAYPIFQIDTENFNCTPNPPQNGGQFICSTSLSSKMTNHTLSVFVNPNAATQQFQIDYIRYGPSSQAAQAASGTVLNVQSPDDSTPGLMFDSNWQSSKSLGGANDVKSAMLTSTPLSTATCHFVGDSFAWWGCCMPPGTSSNAANVTYSIDGGDPTPIQIDGQFLQGPQCKNEKILFQTQPGQLQAGSHVLDVVYNGDDTKMPLTLCALAAVPLDFTALDVQPSGSNPQAHSSSSTLSLSTPASTPSTSTSTITSPLPLGGSPDKKSHTAMIAGIISGVAAVLIIISVCIIWWRKSAKHRAQERRSSSMDSLLPFVFHPVVGFIDMEKRASTAVPSSTSASSSLPAPGTAPSDMPAAPPVSHEQDEHNRPRSTEIPSNSSPLESRPPSYRNTGSLLDS